MDQQFKRQSNGKTQTEQQKENNCKNEDMLKNLWDNTKHSDIHLTRVPEGEENLGET